MAQAEGKRRIYLIESTEPVEKIKEKLRAEGIKDAEEFELWVRTPDDPNAEPVQYASRLCSCRTVCIGFPPPPPQPPGGQK